MKTLKILVPYVRYQVAHIFKPAKDKKSDFLKEEKAWVYYNRFTPFGYFSEKYRTFGEWMNKRKQEKRADNDYSKSIVARHEKYPEAGLNQLRYKPRREDGEKSIKEVIKTHVKDEDVELNLKVTLYKLSSVQKSEKWQKSIIIEEYPTEREDVDRLPKNIEIGKIYRNISYANTGDQDWLDIEGKIRQGLVYGDDKIKELEEKVIADKKKSVKVSKNKVIK